MTKPRFKFKLPFFWAAAPFYAIGAFGGNYLLGHTPGAYWLHAGVTLFLTLGVLALSLKRVK